MKEFEQLFAGEQNNIILFKIDLKNTLTKGHQSPLKYNNNYIPMKPKWLDICDMLNTCLFLTIWW